MARRKHRPRGEPPREWKPLAGIIGTKLPPGAVTRATALTHKGRPVIWHEGILYCDGKAIGRRPHP